MSQRQVQFIETGPDNAARRLAVLYQPPSAAAERENAPGIVWLPGFKSQMLSQKADALAKWTAARGLAYTRFDYSGHGLSDGAFDEGTISDWLADCEAVFRRITLGAQILVGSSMGGWLALLLLRRLQQTAPEQAARIKGLALIAPAWNMTQDLMWDAAPETVRDELRRTGRYMRPSAYEDGPYPITMQLIEDGRAHLFTPQDFDPRCPVAILHGALDPDVPFERSQKLQGYLAGDHVSITRVADGAHRLSRPQDLAQLFAIIENLLERRAA